MVKSLPGADHGDVLNFLGEAKLVSFQGDALAVAVTDWEKKLTSNSRSTMNIGWAHRNSPDIESKGGCQTVALGLVLQRESTVGCVVYQYRR